MKENILLQPFTHFDSQLHQAAWIGDLDTLEKLFQQGVDLNSQIDLAPDDYAYRRQVTPLMLAALSNQGASITTVRWLVEHGANVTIQSAAYYTVIWYALAFWYVDEQGQLRADNTDIDRCAEQIDRLRYLLPVCPTQNIKELLAETCRGGATNTVALLLKKGALSVSTPNSPIVLAAASGVVECVQLLLDAGANPNRYDELGRTPLMVAKTSAVVKQLLAVGADIHATTRSGDDVFTQQLQNSSQDSWQILELLFAAGVDLEQQDKYKKNRLYRAALWGDAQGVKFLLAHTSHIDEDQFTALDTPLHAVCWCGDGDNRILTIDYLLQSGIDINTKNVYGNTPLHAAASQAYGCAGGDGAAPALAAALLSRGAYIDSVNHAGETPLIATVKGQYFEESELACLKLLVTKGANLHHRDLDDKSAKDYAQEIHNFLL
jgi:ankyrin repeat protein